MIRETFGLKKSDISEKFRTLRFEKEGELRKSFVYTRNTKSETRARGVDRRARDT